MTETLEVRRDGTVVARLTGRQGTVRCQYSDEILDTTPLGRPVLSCSLLVASRPADASAWVRGFLPEGQHLHALAALADVAASDTFSLIARYGRDIAGAFEIVTTDPPPRTPSIEPYTSGTLHAAVAGLEVTPLGIHDDSELSLAGLQDKLLAVRTDAGWARPVNGYPSTHIIKVDDARHPGLVAAEAACLTLAAAVGLTTVKAQCETLGGRDVIVLPRFDRESDDGTVRRLHQEDLLQALGIDPVANRNRAKYQNVGTSGPPSWWHAADLLDSYAGDLPNALRTLVRTVAFTMAISNADCHAKNVSFLLENGQLALAPLYDTVPTALWPNLCADAALTVNDVASLDEVTVEDIVAEARRWHTAANVARRFAIELLEELRAAVGSCAHPQVSALVVANTERMLRGRV